MPVHRMTLAGLEALVIRRRGPGQRGAREEDDKPWRKKERGASGTLHGS